MPGLVDDMLRTEISRGSLRDVMGNVACALNGSRLPSEMEVRRIWAGTFRNEDEQARTECLALLRRTLEDLASYEPAVLGSSLSSSWKVELPKTDTIRVLLDGSKSPLSQFSRDEVVVFPNLVCGLPLGGIVMNALKRLGRDPAGYSLVGYSKNGDTRFDDGEPMRGEVYLHDRDAALAKALSAGRTALIVDDSESSDGISKRFIAGRLSRLGFRRIYKTTGHHIKDARE